MRTWQQLSESVNTQCHMTAVVGRNTHNFTTNTGNMSTKTHTHTHGSYHHTFFRTMTLLHTQQRTWLRKEEGKRKKTPRFSLPHIIEESALKFTAKML